MGGQIAIYSTFHFTKLVKQLVLIAPSGLVTFTQVEKGKTKTILHIKRLKVSLMKLLEGM